MIKLNDNKNGLSSNNIIHQKNAIHIHKIVKKKGIKITDFDYIPDFGITNKDWIDDLHWNLKYHYKWSKWIINKINYLYKKNNNNNKKLLIISDSSLDYIDTIGDKNINRKEIFRKILDKYNIKYNIVAKGGGSFSSKYKSNNFFHMINKKKIKNNKYSLIIIIGGINDCFSKNKKHINIGIKKFIRLSKKLLI